MRLAVLAAARQNLQPKYPQARTTRQHTAAKTRGAHVPSTQCAPRKKLRPIAGRNGSSPAETVTSPDDAILPCCVRAAPCGGKLQQKLVRDGYRLRVYIPFGVDWFPYFMRRLAERPANVTFFLRNLLPRSQSKTSAQ